MSKEIALHGKYGHGKFSIVDDSDYELLIQYKWYGNPDGYAIGERRVKITHGTPLMHRVILRASSEFYVDHKNHNRLDNQRNNLRIATHSENTRNQLPLPKKSSKYKGVSWCKNVSRWKAKIASGKKSTPLGQFSTQREAALAYNQAALIRFGEFAFLNTIEENDPDDAPVIRTKKPIGNNPYRGVKLSNDMRTWQARITVHKKTICLGDFPSPEDAARAYDAAALRYLGDKAFLNFQESALSPIESGKPLVVQATEKTNSLSKYRGVSYNKRCNRWVMTVKVNHVRTVEYHTDEVAAARSYDAHILHSSQPVIYVNFLSATSS